MHVEDQQTNQAVPYSCYKEPCTLNFTLMSVKINWDLLTRYCTENVFQILGADFGTDLMPPVQLIPPVPRLPTQRATYSKFVRLKHSQARGSPLRDVCAIGCCQGVTVTKELHWRKVWQQDWLFSTKSQLALLSVSVELGGGRGPGEVNGRLRISVQAPFL